MGKLCIGNTDVRYVQEDFFQCTRDYGCLVINKVSTSAKLEDRVFYYKADPRGPPPVQIW